MNNDLFFPPEATMHPLLNCLKLWLLFRSAACIALLICRGARPSPPPPPYEDSSPLWSPGPRPRAGDPPGPTPLLWGIPWRSCRRARSWRKSSSSAEGRRMNPGLENSWAGLLDWLWMPFNYLGDLRDALKLTFCLFIFITDSQSFQ